MQNTIKILLTAGHAATTAYSLVEEIKEVYPEWEIYWIGTQKAIEGRQILTLEHKIFSDLGVHYYTINSGRIQRKFTPYTIPSILKIPLGFSQAFWNLVSIKPSVIVSFGGHTSFPVVVSAYFLGIPIVIHEQTAAAGLANRICAKFADKIAISRPTSIDYFPKKKTVLIGNLVSREVAAIKHKAKMGKPGVIYITGGSRGSQILNKAVDKALEKLMADFIIYHQTGDLDFDYFSKKRNSRYHPFNSLPPVEISRIFQMADIIVSRAGANTVSEIMIARRPSILIPIPWVQNDEQSKNADFAVKSGIAIILPESELNPKSLVEKIMFVKKHWAEMVKSAKSDFPKLDKNASRRMIALIKEVIK